MIAQIELDLGVESRAPLPRGWTYFGDSYQIAMDESGFLWSYPENARWVLIVGYFSSTFRKRLTDDLACVYRHGWNLIDLPISETGTITMPDGRKIGPKNWNH
jgi:hypothetical protein